MSNPLFLVQVSILETKPLWAINEQLGFGKSNRLCFYRPTDDKYQIINKMYLKKSKIHCAHYIKYDIGSWWFQASCSQMGTTPNYGYTLQKRTGFADYDLITQHKRIRLRISLKHKISFIFREKKCTNSL